MLRKDLELTGLVNLEEWQEIQDSFSEVLGVSLNTVSAHGKLLTRPSRPNRICCEILPHSPFYRDFCGQCILRKRLERPIEIKGEAHFQCLFGLDVCVVPIAAVGESNIAYIVLGPLVLNNRKDTAECTEEARRLGLRLEEVLDALVEVNVFSYNKIYSINKLVQDIFSHIAQSGYHKKRLGEMAPEIREMDPLFARYYEEKILSSLLKACSLALDADSGSVMTMDKDTHILHIKAASKLDEDIVNNTNVKVGEGIAGLAAATAEPIILPRDEDKPGLSQRMKRKHIRSSMIVPFSKPFNREESNGVYGVINLNMVRKDKNFSKRDIAFVQELVNLSSIALIPFLKSNLPPSTQQPTF